MGKVCPLALDTMVPRAKSRDQNASLNIQSRVANMVFFRQMDMALHDGVTRKFWLGKNPTSVH